MRRHFLHALAMTVLLTVTVVEADVDAGRYTLTKREKVTLYSNGEPAPSCGQTAMAKIAKARSIDVLYDGRVRVNGVEWTLLKVVNDMASALEPSKSKDTLRTSLQFWRNGRVAKGHLVVSRLDDNQRLICADTIGFTGTFSRR
jgi:hypothetical protein